MSNINTPEVMPLQLTDLVPQNATFFLKEIVDEDGPIALGLRRWSLLVRKWVIDKYTAKGVRMAFERLEISVIADVTYYLLDERSKLLFKNQDDFLDKIVTVQDQINIISAVVKTMGIGEVELKKFSDAMADKNKKETEAFEDPNYQAPSP